MVGVHGNHESIRAAMNHVSNASLSPEALSDAAWGLCALGFQAEAKPIAERILKGQISKFKSTNQKMLEIVTDLNIQASPAWRVALEETEKIEQEKLEVSRMHADVMLALDQVSSSRIKWLRNTQAGTYRVDFFDEATKTVIDLDNLARPINRNLKRKHLKLQGFKSVTIDYWRFRAACRTSETQETFFKQALGRM